ncbi:lactonase family protein [Brachybacterium saurashtrense]|uniref:3-carboxymuconate cyclase n=1 Tax=Brachybacterium saurashtrense TaxID=556288 RepID=A0A345YPH0_9MICO|nr:beta-propeller fold lactonase family protein [Brachybacterium saurashtrense]AXK45822.1 3-carboxymuconate cyclase [Brachybacterium saurashtrense]RRR24841.1 3-carboxymuconate cyclase [Brachybacterium saurashtrense]
MTTTALLAAGGYSRSGSGRGPGITLLALSDDGPGSVPALRPRATVDLPDPSFLLWSEDGTVLHAVLETDPSRVVALRVAPDGDGMEILGDLALRGGGACHLARGTDPSTLLVAQYGAGTVETVRLDAEGVPRETIDVDDHGEHEDRGGHGAEVRAHPHQVVRLPGTALLAVPDLGLDRVLLYGQQLDGTIDLAGEIPVGRGSGPRHLAADHESEQLHLSCELSGMVATAVRSASTPPRSLPSALRGPSRRWGVRSMIPASARPGANAVSHLELTADESALLVANRGPDTLSVLSLDGMRPQLVAEVEVGAHPRHFTQVGDLVLVAAQEGDRIDVLRRRGEQLEPAADPVTMPSVACLAVRP